MEANKIEIQERLRELSYLNCLDQYDINDLIIKAIQSEIKKNYNIYIVRDDIKININETLKRNIDSVINRVLKEFGTIEEFQKIREISYLNNHLTFSSWKGEETTIKDNKIIKIKTYSLYNGFYSIVDSIYNFYEDIINNRHLQDRSEVIKYIEDNNLKKDSYEKSGYLKIKDMEFTLYKNGRLDITFKNNEIATKFFNEYQRLNNKIKDVKFKL